MRSRYDVYNHEIIVVGVLADLPCAALSLVFPIFLTIVKELDVPTHVVGDLLDEALA